MTTDLVVVEIPEGEILDSQEALPEVGQWFWVPFQGEERLACVTRVGTNYAEVTWPSEHYRRVHFDEWAFRREMDPTSVIQGKVGEYRKEANELMAEVQRVTALLGIVPVGVLPPGAETAALSTVGSKTGDFSGYKGELARTKTEVLPELFKKLTGTHEQMALWMRAETLPLKAQVASLKGVYGRIDDRVFNVELYAGLSEQIERIQDGDPAPAEERVRLFQRLCAMDEEGLLNYATGGMDFSSIDKFDTWLLRPENLDRLLPYPRCIVSFRVRRFPKEAGEIRNYIQLMNYLENTEANKLTFLYIRNGQQVYRMSTAMAFGETLFPQRPRDLSAGTWVRMAGNSVEAMITQAQYEGLCEEYDRAEEKYEQKKAQDLAEWEERQKAAQARGEPFEEERPTYWGSPGVDPRRIYRSFDPSYVYYDEVKKKIDEEVQYHNRVVLILQGLFDRSSVLHPHPPWKLWTDAGMAAAVELIYDKSAALVTGDEPDFEAYRARCNASLKVGSLTVGQRQEWRAAELVRQNSDRRYDEQLSSLPSEQGPPNLARVTAVKKGKVSYCWSQQSANWRRWGTAKEDVRKTGTVDMDSVLNIDAYRPGDFKVFFDDPRTRQKYLEWAPMMLEAEEYHAGNRAEVPMPEVAPRKPPTPEGKERYRKAKLLSNLKDKIVFNRYEIRTQGGIRYEAGLRWKVVTTERGKCTIVRVDAAGEPLRATTEDGGFSHVGCVRGMDPRYLVEE